MNPIDVNDLARQLAVLEKSMEVQHEKYESGLSRVMEYIAQREAEAAKEAAKREARRAEEVAKRDAEAAERETKRIEEAAKRDAEAAKRDAEAAKREAEWKAESAKRENRVIQVMTVRLGIAVAVLALILRWPFGG